MNIVYFIRDITDCGGIQQTTCLTLNELSRRNPQNSYSVISLINKYESTFFPLNDGIRRAKLFDGNIDTKKEFFRIKSELSKNLGDYNADILVVQGVAFSVYLSSDIWKNVKVVVCEHGHFNMGRVLGLHWLGAKIALKKSSAIITLTEMDSLNYIKRNRKSIIIKHIYNPLPYKTEIEYCNESKVIVSCGTLDNIKRFDHVVEAAKRIFAVFPDWKWEIYGDGPNRSSLEKLIHDYKLEDKVFLMGYEKDKRKIYSNKAFFVLTSVFEGFGMVLTEAMSYSLPLISYDIPYGPKEIIEEGKNGMLVQAANISALVSSVEYLIQNPDVRVHFSNECKNSLPKFDIQYTSRQWLKLFDEILRGETNESV
jgi:glycosyltransferase involved in cell wall biosynthesis